MVEFFKNRGNECFICSLANLLLVKFKDRETAEKVCNSAGSHPLVFEEGIHAPTWPKLTSELSEGKYEGTLYVDSSSFDNLSKLEEIIPKEEASFYRKAIEESLGLGRIILITDKGECFYPMILAVNKEYEGHVIVALDREYVIDDGFLKKISIQTLECKGYSIECLFRVEKSIESLFD